MIHFLCVISIDVWARKDKLSCRLTRVPIVSENPVNISLPPPLSQCHPQFLSPFFLLSSSLSRSVSLLLPVFSRSFLPTLSPPDFVYCACVCAYVCLCQCACEKKVSSLVRRRAAALVFLLACAIEGDMRQAPGRPPVTRRCRWGLSGSLAARRLRQLVLAVIAGSWMKSALTKCVD